MPLTNAKNKKHIYAWRELNRDKHLEMCKRYKKRQMEWAKIRKIYFNILID